MDRGAWQALVHGVAKSQTWLKQLSTQFCNLWNKCIHWVFPKTFSAVLCYISIDLYAAGLGREWKRRKKRWCSWHFYWPFPHSLLCLWVKVPRWVGWTLQAFWLFYTSECALWSSGNKPAGRKSHVFTLRSHLCHRWHPRTPNICDKQLLGISVHVGCGFCLPQSLGVPTYIWASLVPQIVKNLPAMQENWARSLGQEYPLEKRMAVCSSILPGESHGQRSLVGYWLQSIGSQSRTRLSDGHFHFHLYLLAENILEMRHQQEMS